MSELSIRELCKRQVARMRAQHPDWYPPEPKEDKFLRILREMDKASEIEPPNFLEILDKAGIKYVGA